MNTIKCISNGQFARSIEKFATEKYWNANPWHVAVEAVDKLDIPDDSQRLWAIDDKHVKTLAESIRVEGMIVPVGVKYVKADDDKGAHNYERFPKCYRLIYGKHRVMAMLLLHDEWCKENPDKEPQTSPWLDIQVVVFSPTMTEKDCQRYEAIENLQRRQMTNEEKTALSSVLAGKKLGKLAKVKAIAEESAKQAEVVEEKDFIEKSIKSPKSKTNPGKPVTQTTVADAVGVSQPTVLDAFKTIEAVTGVKIDLDKPETIKEAITDIEAVMVIAGEDDDFAEDVRDKIKTVEKKSKAERRVTTGRAQSVIVEAEKRGRVDLVEDIKTNPDMKMAVVEAAEEMGISVRRSCLIELHEPAASIVDKLFKNFSRETMSEMALMVLKRLKDMPIESAN